MSKVTPANDLRRIVTATIPVAGVVAIVAVLTSLSPAASVTQDKDEAPPILRAVCVVQGLNDSGVEGAVTFTVNGDVVDIDAEISGLKPGLHGFHIHEYGDCSSLDGKSAGGHFNPHDMPHAGPDAKKRHVGDLGNLRADANGVAVFHLTDKLVHLNGADSVIGRAIIIHADPDDLKTQPTGNAGGRVACGVIGIAKPKE